MVKKHNLHGYEAFCEFVDNISKSDSKVYYIYFGGNVQNGKSWCPDCVRAKPIIEKALDKVTEEVEFVNVEVGDRSYWKDAKCPFREDKRLRLMVIPTLIKWNTPQRLEGDQCEKPDLLEMMFTDDD